MPRVQRTFGWIQNPSSTDNLKKIVSLFVKDSDFQTLMLQNRLPLLRDAHLLQTVELYDTFVNALSQTRISYALLKGFGCGSDSRASAKCSGLAQAALTGQQFKTYHINGKSIRIKKPYTDDWTADGFLRWAVSLGFLDYNYDDDTCSLSESGKAFVLAKTEIEENQILGNAYLAYPPACRVLGILSDGNHYTKFEIGKLLGFTDEAGFTSIPQNIWVQAYEMASDQYEKSKLRSDVEGSSDKYARMICGWLEHIGWITKSPKQVTETVGSNIYTTTINAAFSITAQGLKNYKRAMGKSSSSRISKIVYREMLASKAPNAELLRTRRATILKYIGGVQKRSLAQLVEHLQNHGFEVTEIMVKDDLKGLKYIGMNIVDQYGEYHLLDTVTKLVIPTTIEVDEDSQASIIRERVREKLQHIDHKYLNLIDYSFEGKDNRIFEIFTIDLFTNELQFIGQHLGGTRKPDGIISYNQNGVIIDNKAYSKGFTIDRHMADEMIRYVQENNERRPERNPNMWWEHFPSDLVAFNFVFISSLFRGEVNSALSGIKESTGVNGAALNTENLLYFADAIKGGLLSYDAFIEKLNHNTEVTYS